MKYYNKIMMKNKDLLLIYKINTKLNCYNLNRIMKMQNNIVNKLSNYNNN